MAEDKIDYLSVGLSGKRDLFWVTITDFAHLGRKYRGAIISYKSVEDDEDHTTYLDIEKQDAWTCEDDDICDEIHD